jgi:hypothetical protein
MYCLSAPILVRGLQTLLGYVDRISSYAAEHNLDVDEIITYQETTDSVSFAARVHIAVETLASVVAELTGKGMPRLDGSPSNVDGLRDKILQIIKFAQSADIAPSQLRHQVELQFQSISGSIQGDAIILTTRLANSMFHIASAHTILERHGLRVGGEQFFDFLSSKTAA